MKGGKATVKDLGVGSTLFFTPTSRVFTVVNVTKKHLYIQQLDRNYEPHKYTFKKLQDRMFEINGILAGDFFIRTVIAK